MKKLLSILLFLSLLLCFNATSFAINLTNMQAEKDITPFETEATSAVLMEANTGKILYSKNSDEALPPASVTKIMTILLLVEGIKDDKISLTDNVCVSEYASSMGGSQVFLKEGEKMSVEELLKCTIIASANDAAVALAEHLAGSEANFVRMMNERAASLGLTNTFFENVTGLDDTTNKHYSSANDIATMSRELIKYPIVTKYSSMWQDTIRNGDFTLTNTNRLVRFYDGCNGLKTGSTAKAGYCVSTTASRGDMDLIAVVMNAPSRDTRNKIARELLDYGFANYAIYHAEEEFVESAPVYFGKADGINIYSKEFFALVEKDKIKKVEMKYEIPEYIVAPINSGNVVGKIVYEINGEEIGTTELFVKENIEKQTFWGIFVKILKTIVGAQ